MFLDSKHIKALQKKNQCCPADDSIAPGIACLWRAHRANLTEMDELRWALSSVYEGLCSLIIATKTPQVVEMTPQSSMNLKLCVLITGKAISHNINHRKARQYTAPNYHECTFPSQCISYALTIDSYHAESDSIDITINEQTSRT